MLCKTLTDGFRIFFYKGLKAICPVTVCLKKEKENKKELK